MQQIKITVFALLYLVTLSSIGQVSNNQNSGSNPINIKYIRSFLEKYESDFKLNLTEQKDSILQVANFEAINNNQLIATERDRKIDGAILSFQELTSFSILLNGMGYLKGKTELIQENGDNFLVINYHILDSDRSKIIKSTEIRFRDLSGELFKKEAEGLFQRYLFQRIIFDNLSQDDINKFSSVLLDRNYSILEKKHASTSFQKKLRDDVVFDDENLLMKKSLCQVKFISQNGINFVLIGQ